MAYDPQGKLESFFRNHKKLLFKKGSIVLRAGDAPTGVYYLSRGFIKDTALSPEGQELTLFIFKPEDLFPYSWFFNKEPNLHSYTAMTDVLIYKCSLENFSVFIDSNPDVLFMITQRVLKRLGGLMERLKYMVFGKASDKIASILLILAERFGEKTSNGIKILLPVSHKDIAELLGITRETASIEIKKIEDAGIIVRSGKYYLVVNKQLLKKRSSLIPS